MTTKTKLKDQILDYLKENANISFSAEKLGRALQMADADSFTPIVQALAELEREKKVTVTDRGEFKAVIKPQAIVGTFHANDKGFGFVDYDPDLPDMYINPDHTMHALNGDQVEVKILRPAKPGSDQGPEGQVVKIVEHNYDQIVGEFKQETVGDYIGEILLKDKKLSNYRFFVNDQGLKPMDGQVVTATVATYPDDEAPQVMTGAVNEVIGDKDEPGIDILSVIYAHDVPHEFPQEVMDEANKIPLKVLPEEKKGREDITDQPLVTIDAIESKDLDDAVVAWKMDNGHYHLGVHIADVSYYVTEGSALDKEALNRATSVYVTDRVVPMLPERLSNGICSLNPQVDRLTQSAIMEIDKHGRVVHYTITQTVIKTSFRMTYSAVNDILAGDEEKRQEFKKIVPSIELMAKLHERLESMREKRGALNFDTSEAKILVDKKGKPVDIVLRQRGIAERMIESFMLIANETVAEHFSKLNLPFIYRIHEEPKAEKVQKFIDYASSFGLRIYGTASEISQEALQDIMRAVEGEPYADVLSMMLLRSMQQARYSEHNHGHYGLAADYYTHFTSPIRRYPDLLVHRMIRDYGRSKDVAEHFEQVIPEIATQSSNRERRAIEAEREVEAMKKAEYMEEYVGEEYDAVVSSIVKFGLFVELPNTVEGLIHITNLPEFYHFNERDLTLRGEKSGITFRVGQQVRIRVERADKMTGEIDFSYIPSEFDVIEKGLKQAGRKDRSRGSSRRSDKKEDKRKSGRSNDKHKHSQKNKKKKGKKPFYKEVAKKGAKHGKGRGKGRRTK